MPGLRYTAEEKKKLEYTGIELGWNDPDLGYTHAEISNKAIIDWLKSKEDPTSVTIAELDKRCDYRSAREEEKEDFEFEL